MPVTRVLRDQGLKTENESVFKLHYAQENLSSWLSSLHTFAESIPFGLRAQMSRGSPGRGGEPAGGEREQVWDGRTQVGSAQDSALWPWRSSFALQSVWLLLGLRLGCRGDTVCASLQDRCPLA